MKLNTVFHICVTWNTIHTQQIFVKQLLNKLVFAHFLVIKTLKIQSLDSEKPGFDSQFHFIHTA